jgi:hypothetical protein
MTVKDFVPGLRVRADAAHDGERGTLLHRRLVAVAQRRVCPRQEEPGPGQLEWQVDLGPDAPRAAEVGQRGLGRTADRLGA